MYVASLRILVHRFTRHTILLYRGMHSILKLSWSLTLSFHFSVQTYILSWFFLFFFFRDRSSCCHSGCFPIGVHFRIVRLSTWRFQWCPPRHHVIPFCFIFAIDWFLILFNWRYLLDPWRKNFEDISRLSLKCMTLDRWGLVTCPSFLLDARILRFYCLSTTLLKYIDVSHVLLGFEYRGWILTDIYYGSTLSVCMMISLRDELRLRRLLTLTRDLLSEQTQLITVQYSVSNRRYRP